MLQACLNGRRSKAEHPKIPYSPAELAADALTVRIAGAETLHLHPRASDGRETLEPDAVAQAVDAIRAAVPGMPLGVSSGEWIAPGGAARLDLIRAWQVPPDYVSVNIIEADSAETVRILMEKGIGIEAGLWTHADARKFAGMANAKNCLRVLLEINHPETDAALQETHLILEALKASAIDLPILLHGLDATVWPLVDEARRLDFSTRVGFEDGLTLPDGSIADDNAAIVAAARRIVDG